MKPRKNKSKIIKTVKDLMATISLYANVGKRTIFTIEYKGFQIVLKPMPLTDVERGRRFRENEKKK